MQKHQFVVRPVAHQNHPTPSSSKGGPIKASANDKFPMKPMSLTPGKSKSVAMPEIPMRASVAKAAPKSDLKSVEKFSELDLPAIILQAIKAMNYETPTPIQAQAIAPALQGRDILGCAQTGTGKTAAFLIPMVAKLLNSPLETALILAPTRELAAQIETVLRDLTVHCKSLNHAVLIGGMSMQPQMRALQKRPRIVIATPGRLIDHLERRTVSLQKTSFLVLDEADRMLDMGFAPQLREILKTVPKERQTLLFSATIAPEIRKLTQNYLKNPVEVAISPNSKTADNIKQSSITTDAKQKLDVLLDEINARKGSMIIFARTQHRADRLSRSLKTYNLDVGVIHGGKSQGQRNRALQAFRDEETRILVATDVAARGLDIPHVAHVINYDLPQQAEDYVHRIGRTARAGGTGEALSMITPDEKHLWKKITLLLRAP
jgi:ATP-dependent RNA helicase DeaD